MQSPTWHKLQTVLQPRAYSQLPLSKHMLSKVMYVMHNRPSGLATELMLHTPIATYKEHTRLRKSKQLRAKSLLLSFSALLCRGSLIHRGLPSAVILLPRRQGISTGQGPRTVPGGYRKNTGSAHKKVPTEPHHTHTPPSHRAD